MHRPTAIRALHPTLLVAVLLAATACAPEPDYLPLEAGRWWYYAVESTVLDETNRARVIMANLGPARLDGQRVYLRRRQAHALDYLQYDGEHPERGVRRVAHRRPGPTGIVRDQPARVLLREDGAWRVPSTLGLIESRTFAAQDRIIPRRVALDLSKRVVRRDATTTVPAGHFTACLLVVGEGRVAVRTDRGNASAMVTVRTREWYARGIGLVRLEREERADSTFLRNGRQIWVLVAHGD